MQLILAKRKTAERIRGFTLIELLTVIAIVSILLAVSIPAFSSLSGNGLQASREIIKAHLQQARAHAISSGNSTAVVFPTVGSDSDLGASSVSLFEVESDGSGSYLPAVDTVTGKEIQLQRWAKLPGNIRFVSASAISSSSPTIADQTSPMLTDFSKPISCHFIVFSPNGQIMYPLAGTAIHIAIAQTAKNGSNLTITLTNEGTPVFDLLQVNRLTGRTRDVDP